MNDTSPVTVRLPAQLAGAIREKATQERRSLNGMIVYLLEQIVASPAPASRRSPRSGSAGSSSPARQSRSSKQSGAEL